MATSTPVESKEEKKEETTGQPKVGLNDNGLGLNDFLTKQEPQEGVEGQATKSAEENPPAEKKDEKPEPSAGADKKPESQGDAAGQEANKKEKDPHTMKVEKENYKLREFKREASARMEKQEQDIQKLKELVGSADPVPEKTDAQKELEVKQEAKKAYSLKRFKETRENGEQLLEEKIFGEEAPYKTLEKRANSGDLFANIQHQRVMASDDPFEEALVVLQEEELFEKHGTRSLLKIIEKEIEARKEAIKNDAMKELKGSNGQPVGKAPKTLQSLGGGDANNTNLNKEPEFQSLSDMALFKHLST